MSETPLTTPPDRLSTDPASPHFDEELLKRGIGIRFKGVEKTNVEEYCVSEGWVRLSAGKTLDRAGNPMTVKLKGPLAVGVPVSTGPRRSGGTTASTTGIALFLMLVSRGKA